MKKSEDYCSDNLYAVSIKEDTAYMCLHFTRNHEDLKVLYAISRMLIRRIEDQCMTRSLKKYLVQPFKNHELVFRSSRKLSKTRSLDYSSSPEFNFISDLEDQFKEEETDTMGKPTMEEYMTKTRDGYGGSDNEDANEHIKKVLEIVDLFHIPNITQDQVMLRVFPMSLTGAASRWLRNEPAGSTKTWETLKEKFLSKYCPPARTAKKMEEINNFQQDPDETLYQAWE
ncbi:zinc finger, CCHC-type containing protein [Tanacetum coccineum]